MADSRSELKAEVRKHWRRRYAEEMAARGEALPADFRESEPDDGLLTPPDARRVARRAACLATVALRGLASTWAKDEQSEFVPALQAWFAESGLDDELEPDERATIAAAAGELAEQAAVDACWRWEGAAVLAASLGRLTLPSHDAVVDTQACGEACGVFADPAALAKLVEGGAFAPSFDRCAYADRVLAIAWRLRQFLQVERKPLDFAKYAAGVEWAKFDLRGVPLLGGDLAIRGKPLAAAAEGDIAAAMSIAAERQTAANWLIGWDPIYGEVETPT